MGKVEFIPTDEVTGRDEFSEVVPHPGQLTDENRELNTDVLESVCMAVTDVATDVATAVLVSVAIGVTAVDRNVEKETPGELGPRPVPDGTELVISVALGSGYNGELRD